MDIKKIQEIVESSQMTDEAKDLVYELLKNIDKPGTKEEIIKVIGYEIDMNELIADEAEEILESIKNGEKMIDAVEDRALEQADDLEKSTNEKLANLDAEQQAMDKDLEAFKPQTPVVAAPPVAAAPVANAWSQPAAPVANTWSQPAAPAATQPAPFPGTQAGQ